jgi:outer membrane lipoprotein-sorting protein
MNRIKRFLPVLFLLALPILAAKPSPDANAIVRAAMTQWRGTSSYTTITMTIHRPKWERTMAMTSWTRGDDDALVRFTAPAGDAGNATLKLGDAMWMFTPKLNQVIKLPMNMMAQSWMGSDFSYNDLAKSEQILHDYTLKITKTEKRDGHTVYTVEALPKANAPVVWGKQVLKIRDDHLILEETFYDQDMKPLKRLTATRIGRLGGRLYVTELRMRPLDKTGRWTEIRYLKGTFDVTIPKFIFTLSNLRNPRNWRPR